MRLRPIITIATTVATAFLLISCRSPTPPDGVKVIDNFAVNRYLGTWYEIARLDHRFERGLEQVTATYSPREDGGLNVLNRGYSTKNSKWKQREGKAYFTGESHHAALKVSFFGPFYGGYNVIALDDNYQYALVCGPNRDYLWILSRTQTLSPEVKQRLLDVATRQDFAVDKLIWVKPRPH